MSLEDAIEKNTQAINKLTDAVSASLEGQNEALRALTSIVDKDIKDMSESAPKAAEKPKKAEPVKQVAPEPEPELEPEEDLLVANDEEVNAPAITYETIVKRFREIAVEKGGKEFAVKLLGKYGIKRLEATALPAEKFPAFWEEMSKFKISNGANNG